MTGEFRLHNRPTQPLLDCIMLRPGAYCQVVFSWMLDCCLCMGKRSHGRCAANTLSASRGDVQKDTSGGLKSQRSASNSGGGLNEDEA